MQNLKVILLSLVLVLSSISASMADECTAPTGYPFENSSPGIMNYAMAMNGFYDSVISGPSGLVAMPFMGSSLNPPFQASFGVQWWDTQSWKTLSIDNANNGAWSSEPKFAFFGNKFYSFISAKHADNLQGVWMYSQKPDGSFNAGIQLPGLSNNGSLIIDVYAVAARNKIATVSWNFSKTFYTEIPILGAYQTREVLIDGVAAPGRPRAVGIMPNGTPWVLMVSSQNAVFEIYLATMNPRGLWTKAYSIAQESGGSLDNPMAVQTPDANRPRIMFTWTHSYPDQNLTSASTYARFLELPSAGTLGNLTRTVELKKFTNVNFANVRSTNVAFRADGLTGEIVVHDSETKQAFIAAIEGELVRPLTPFHPELIETVRPSVFFNSCGFGFIESRGLANKADAPKIFIEKLPTP